MLIPYEMGGIGFGAAGAAGGPLYMPTGTILACWDDPATLLGSSVLVPNLTGAGPDGTLIGDLSQVPPITLRVSALGALGTAQGEASFDGGNTYQAAQTLYPLTEIGGGYSIAWAGGTSFSGATGRIYVTGPAAWLDQTNNGDLSLPSSSAVARSTWGPANLARVPDRNTSVGYLSASRFRSTFTTLNSAISFAAVYKTTASNINSHLFTIGTAVSNSAFAISVVTGSKVSVTKSNVVNSTTTTATSTGTRAIGSWTFVAWTSNGTSGNLYLGMSASPENFPSWASTSGTFATTFAHFDGVFGGMSPTADGLSIAAVMLANTAWSAGDISALRDSVSARYGSGVIV